MNNKKKLYIKVFVVMLVGVVLINVAESLDAIATTQMAIMQMQLNNASVFMIKWYNKFQTLAGLIMAIIIIFTFKSDVVRLCKSLKNSQK